MALGVRRDVSGCRTRPAIRHAAAPRGRRPDALVCVELQPSVARANLVFYSHRLWLPVPACVEPCDALAVVHRRGRLPSGLRVKVLSEQDTLAVVRAQHGANLTLTEEQRAVCGQTHTVRFGEMRGTVDLAVSANGAVRLPEAACVTPEHTNLPYFIKGPVSLSGGTCLRVLDAAAVESVMWTYGWRFTDAMRQVCGGTYPFEDLSSSKGGIRLRIRVPSNGDQGFYLTFPWPACAYPEGRIRREVRAGSYVRVVSRDELMAIVWAKFGELNEHCDINKRVCCGGTFEVVGGVDNHGHNATPGPGPFPRRSQSTTTSRA